MKKIFNSFKFILPLALLVMVASTSCNKDVPAAMPKVSTTAGSTIGDILNTNPNFSILKAAVTKAGMMAAVSDKNNVFTVFAPSDAAFATSGISLAAINSLSASNVDSIVRYHVIPGRKIMSSSISTTFPNVQMPSAVMLPFVLAPNGMFVANSNPLLKSSNFPSRRGDRIWVNNTSIVTPDVDASNGAVHVTSAVLLRPTRVLLDTISREADMSYLVAAILRADVGVPAGSRFQDYLANPLANFTIMAPTNTAFMALFTALKLPVSPASFGLLPVSTVQGIVAYHVLMGRAFSPNLPNAATPVPTLLSGSLPTAPLLTVDATQGVRGAKNPSYSKITAVDRHAINGVYHKIDQVLMPQ
jgi:uncharacterized surface protein with fasciclin (FAS1) repeats